jgi:predicted phosphodiesterase
MPKFTKTAVVREYIKKYPKLPNASLARLILKKEPLLYESAEAIRTQIRAILGQLNTSRIKDKSMFAPPKTTNPYKLPIADELSYEPYVLKGYKRVALFSDIHVPYHCVNSLSTALAFCKKEKPDLLLLNGDTLDAFSLSKFGKDPRKRNFAGELEVMRDLFIAFQKTLKCEILFKKGNHEERYETYLKQKASELIGIDEFELENIIKARVNGVEIVGDKRVIHANKLNVIHGHEFSKGFFSPVNVARGLALRAKSSAIQGHNHQSSEHTQIDINGKVMTTWSTGSLCQLHPEYAPINNWNNGFAIIDLDSNGEDFEVRNKRIYKGKIL